MQNRNAYEALRLTLAEYLQKTSLNGFRLVYYLRRHKSQRVLWLLFVAFAFAFAVYVVIFLSIVFATYPIVTTIGTHGVDISQVPFPAIAVCSDNKFSRSAIKRYAQQLSALDQRNRTTSYWHERLNTLLPGYFNPDAVDSIAAYRLQMELTQLDAHERTRRPYELLAMLAPSCNDSSQLLRCQLFGQEQACSELFVQMGTADGYCCVYNFDFLDRRHNTELRPQGPEYVDESRALTLLLNTSSLDGWNGPGSDHSIGYELGIFPAHVFPDRSTGGLRELQVSPGELVSVEMSATAQIGSPALRGYSVAQRHCYFTDDDFMFYVNDATHGGYSQATCLARCRLRSVRALCDCLPHYAINAADAERNGVRCCTLADVACLQRYDQFWHTFRPVRIDIMEPPTAVKDSLDCTHCLPACSFIRYDYIKRTSSLIQAQKFKPAKLLLDGRRLVPGVNATNYTMVNIYFRVRHVHEFRKDVLFSWYQILSNIGGVVSICMGCSLISGFELIYFGVYRFACHLLKSR